MRRAPIRPPLSLSLAFALVFTVSMVQTPSASAGIWDNVKRLAAPANLEIALKLEPTAPSGSPKLEQDYLAEAVRRRIHAAGGAVHDLRWREFLIHVKGYFPDPSPAAIAQILAPRHVELRRALDEEATAYWRDKRSELGLPDALERPTDVTLQADSLHGSEPMAILELQSHDRAALEKVIADHPIPDRTWVIEKKSTSLPKPLYAALLLGPAEITSADVASAEPGDDPMGYHHVSVTLTPEGGKRFAAMTAASVKRRIAILVDGAILSVPIVQEPIRGGRIQISLGAAYGLGPDGLAAQKREARSLAAALGAGELPCKVEVVETTILGR